MFIVHKMWLNLFPNRVWIDYGAGSDCGFLKQLLKKTNLCISCGSPVIVFAVILVHQPTYIKCSVVTQRNLVKESESFYILSKTIVLYFIYNYTFHLRVSEWNLTLKEANVIHSTKIHTLTSALVLIFEEFGQAYLYDSNTFYQLKCWGITSFRSNQEDHGVISLK